MTNKIIVYKQENGNLAIVIPTGELSFADVCEKDVPAGIAYKIFDANQVPTDISTWIVDFSTPDGIGIGPEAWAKAHK